MAKGNKAATGGVKSAETVSTKTAEVKPAAESAADAPETERETTSPRPSPPSDGGEGDRLGASSATSNENETPTPEEIEAQAEEMQKVLFGTVHSSVNARLQEEREESQVETAPDPETEGETETEAQPETETETEPVVTKEGEATSPRPSPPSEGGEGEERLVTSSPTGGAKERFVPGAAMTAQEVEDLARQTAREELEAGRGEGVSGEGAGNDTRGRVSYPEGDDGLSDEAADQLVVLQEMAAINPAHRDLPKRQREFWKKEEEYRRAWQQANSGSSFEPLAPEHAEFYRKNEPFVPMRDYKAAERSIIAREAEDRAVNRIRKEIEPRIRSSELKEMEREAAPAITNSMADAAEEVFGAAPQFAEAFKPKELDKKAMEKMEEINPALAQLAREEAERTALLVAELEKLDRLKGHYPVDPKKKLRLSNGQTLAPHAALEEEFAEFEAEMLKKPEAERVREGKKFIPFQQATERAQRIFEDKKLRPDQRARAMESLQNSYWWVQAGDVRAHIVSKSKERVGQYAERFAKMTKTPVNGTAVHTETKPAAAAEAAKAGNNGGRGGKAGLARGTATASVSDVSDNAPRGRSELEKARENLAKTLFP